ncbi:ligase [Lithospermum erythrorhizon]|uniref:Ligase n=1 Tax=Lithospermum erythrorhizon TaxID=34254 RepID=A0AAV3PYG4_LITER
MNCQYAISAAGEVYLLEANPRASRSVPFVSKAIGHPLAKYDAALVMSGKSLYEINFTEEVILRHVSVKEAVLPFEKFQGCDVLLGPEMHSIGDVMSTFYESSIAFTKAQIAAGERLPMTGTLFLSLNDLTKQHLTTIARGFLGIGFNIVATSGTSRVLQLEGIPVQQVLKMREGRSHAADMIANGQIQIMVITSSGDKLDAVDGRNDQKSGTNKLEMSALQDYLVADKEAKSSINLQTASSI